MSEYLIGIMYHEPESYALWKKGIIEDYESSTGIFIEAESPEAAMEWGEHIGEELLRKVNSDPILNWKEFGYFCWVEDDIEQCGWSHCLDFFLHVKAGQMPPLDAMGTPAYERWLEARK